MADMLTVRDLAKRYGEVSALTGLDLDVPVGRIVGFLGPNGAGKTTAMRCIMGLAVPDRGSVHWEGRPVDRRDRLRFGYMPEERGLYPRMRIGDQLLHFARLSGLSRTAARLACTRWLERFDLGDRSRARLDELSHGNQQRVQLAAALVHDPMVAVLDEPFSGLDPIAVTAMGDCLRELADTGTAILFSSHQLDLVEHICQDVVVIDGGRVVLSGTLDELRSRSGRRILEVRVNGAAWSPPGLAGSPSGPGGGDANGLGHSLRDGRFVVDRTVDLEQILKAAQAVGEVDAFSYEPPSLSDLFAEAVTR
jgi:ABC-2 type transport system ATP-binding protein